MQIPCQRCTNCGFPQQLAVYRNLYRIGLTYYIGMIDWHYDVLGWASNDTTQAKGARQWHNAKRYRNETTNWRMAIQSWQAAMPAMGGRFY